MSKSLELPSWMKFWLQLTSFICIFDGIFIIFRPHTFPDGSLGFIFWAYKYYFEVDRMYADLKDSFVYGQGICNLMEVVLNLTCLYLSGHQSRAEGCDFILETVNKKIKAWLPPGVPTEERWTRVCRNLPGMEQMKKCVANRLTSDTNEQQPSYFRLFQQEDAVEAFKNKLRTYLPQQELVSLNKQQLDHDLVNFDHKCETNKENYFKTYPNTSTSYEKIFITVQDRSKYHDIKNKTKATIQNTILNIIKNSQITKQTKMKDVIDVSTKTKLLGLVVTTMTFWKTVLYFIVYYNMDFRAENSFLQELFLIFLLNGVWVVVPFFCMKYLFQDLCANNVGSKLRMHETNGSERTFDFRKSTLKKRQHNN